MGRPAVFVAAPLPKRYMAPLEERCQVTVYHGAGPVSRTELSEQLREAEGLLGPAVLPLDAAVLESALRLRAVSNIGVGYDNVDLDCANRRGILVANTPGILSDAVAELTIGLMLTLARRLRESMAVVIEGRWDRAGAAIPMGVDLKGKTLAIVGMGRIGRQVAQRALAFGMRVVYFDVAGMADGMNGASAASSLEAALRRADFVSLHTNLTPGSRHLIGARELAMMKPEAYLVNTSRGAIVDQSALYEALKEGRIAGAALDVLEEEPPAADEPLLRLANVVITPHIGTATIETRGAMVELAVRNLIACLFDEPCECVVNR
jgi:lactate dehydrogenase-like 2-hydroxyacid dehydrogenase